MRSTSPSSKHMTVSPPITPPWTSPVSTPGSSPSATLKLASPSSSAHASSSSSPSIPPFSSPSPTAVEDNKATQLLHSTTTTTTQQEQEQEQRFEVASTPDEPWIRALLSIRFYGVCPRHSTLRKNERNLFCKTHGEKICTNCVHQPRTTTTTTTTTTNTNTAAALTKSTTPATKPTWTSSVIPSSSQSSSSSSLSSSLSLSSSSLTDSQSSTSSGSTTATNTTTVTASRTTATPLPSIRTTRSSTASQLERLPPSLDETAEKKNNAATNNDVDHSSCVVLHVTRYMYHDVLLASEISRLLDISAIQPYVNNGNRVIYIDRRSQMLSTPSVNSSACIMCSRTLQDPYKFCCIYCRLSYEQHPAAPHDLPLPGAGRLSSSPPPASSAAQPLQEQKEKQKQDKLKKQEQGQKDGQLEAQRHKSKQKQQKQKQQQKAVQLQQQQQELWSSAVAAAALQAQAQKNQTQRQRQRQRQRERERQRQRQGQGQKEKALQEQQSSKSTYTTVPNDKAQPQLAQEQPIDVLSTITADAAKHKPNDALPPPPPPQEREKEASAAGATPGVETFDGWNKRKEIGGGGVEVGTMDWAAMEGLVRVKRRRKGIPVRSLLCNCNGSMLTE